MKYLIQVDKPKTEDIKTSLGALKFPFTPSGFGYITVDIPPEMVSKVQQISGVISVTPEKTRKIMVALPVETKLAEFYRLFKSNPLTGPAQAIRFSIQADANKVRTPTSVSRRLVGAEEADKDGITGKGIKVAVLDTGTDYLCLQGQFFGGRSGVAGQPIPFDENGHGTWCATAIGGRAFSSLRGKLLGVAPGAKVAAFKVLGYGIGAGTTSSILSGLEAAQKWGADIISMSLGGDEPDDYQTDPESLAIKELTEAGIICVVAAGNSGPLARTMNSPGGCEDALTVGAVDINGALVYFSSCGPTNDGRLKPDVMAPGVDLLSSSTGLIAAMQWTDGPKLACISGTSMATPHVAGVIALAQEYARSKNQNLTTQRIKEAMKRFGHPKDTMTGWGPISYTLLKQYIG